MPSDGQHGFYARPSAHLGSLATGHGLGAISRSSYIARSVKGGVVKTFRCRDEINRMATDAVGNTNAVFTSDRFDRTWHPDGGDSHPPPGRDFAVAIGLAFADAGWSVMQLPSDPPDDPRSDHWEHSYWYVTLDSGSESYWLFLEPIGDDHLWRVAFHPRRGCIASLFGPQTAGSISARLKTDTETVVRALTNCDDLQWITDSEAESLW